MPQFLDAYFQQYCAIAKKNFVPLESINSQLDYIKDLPTSENNLIVATSETILQAL